MMRWIVHLLGALAVLLAAIPAAAALVPEPPMSVVAADEHCADIAMAGDQNSGSAQDGDGGKASCCDGAVHGCCPLGASFASLAEQPALSMPGAGHEIDPDLMRTGAAAAPLTEPPTLA